MMLVIATSEHDIKLLDPVHRSDILRLLCFEMEIVVLSVLILVVCYHAKIRHVWKMKSQVFGCHLFVVVLVIYESI